MFVYKITDLLKSLQSAKKDGFEYLAISIIDADPSDEEDCYPDSLCLEYIVSEVETQEDSIDSEVLPDGYDLDLC